MNYEANLLQLWRELNEGRYAIGRSIAFIVNKPVKREIFAADFRDRVVHHLVIRRLNPYFEKMFITDSYSCRPGKGTLYGISRLQQFIRSCSHGYTKDTYVLKMDIRGFFMSINRLKLFDIIEAALQKIVDKDQKGITPAFMQLVNTIVTHDSTQNCFIKGKRSNWDGLPISKSLLKKQSAFSHQPSAISPQLAFDFQQPATSNQQPVTGNQQPATGLPIGNLTSQIFANVYMHQFDFFMKHHLRCKYYGRYVDDFFIVHESRAYLESIIPAKHYNSFRLRRKMIARMSSYFFNYMHPDKNHLKLKLRTRTI